MTISSHMTIYRYQLTGSQSAVPARLGTWLVDSALRRSVLLMLPGRLMVVLQLSICRYELAQRGRLPGSQAASPNSLLMN
jgi:hypothetical protein